VGVVRQLPQHHFQIHIGQPGRQQQVAQLGLFFGAGLDLLPTPEQHLNCLFIEQGAGLRQPAFVGMDQGHDRQQQRVGRKLP
jgi:hypothetical protein